MGGALAVGEDERNRAGCGKIGRAAGDEAVRLSHQRKAAIENAFIGKRSQEARRRREAFRRAFHKTLAKRGKPPRIACKGARAVFALATKPVGAHPAAKIFKGEAPALKAEPQGAGTETGAEKRFPKVKVLKSSVAQ